jgi:predicted ATPase
MHLESFRIQNFRSIKDSGDIEASRITALLGRNESGKSNLLLALMTLNPPEGFAELNRTKDFPRHRRLSECTPDTPVVSSRWRLTAKEQAELVKQLPNASNVAHVRVARPYGRKRTVEFINLTPIAFDIPTIKAAVSGIVEAIKAAASALDAGKQTAINAALIQFERTSTVVDVKENWASNFKAAQGPLNESLKEAGISMPDAAARGINELLQLAGRLATYQADEQTARDWVVGRLPVFIFVDEYPELNGHQNIAQFLQRKNGNTLTDAEKNFEKLCKVAGIDPAQLHSLQGEGKYEERNLIANRASAVVTGELRRLWKDRQLKVRFNPDAEHLEILISDPTQVFDVEVNLDERSRGLRWFFSFYITFSADTNGGAAENAILLLDEPGLFLHIESQKDLQAHFEQDFDNQILYTTHSPFMIPIQTLDRLRTVTISEDNGTVVTNNPTGDGRTLAPIRAALGYYYADSLFIGPNNLIVEGVTDWWILEAVSKHFVSAGKRGLPPILALPPVDGAPKVPNMVSLLTAQKLVVLALLDDEGQARSVREEMIKSRLLRDEQVILISEAFDSERPSEADIEDLLDPTVFEDLARDAYSKELQGRTLVLNRNIPRIVKRFEDAFVQVGLTFHKTRTAGLFYRRMAINPTSLMIGDSMKRFDHLFAIIGARLEKVIARGSDPFH